MYNHNIKFVQGYENNDLLDILNDLEFRLNNRISSENNHIIKCKKNPNYYFKLKSSLRDLFRTLDARY